MKTIVITLTAIALITFSCKKEKPSDLVSENDSNASVAVAANNKVSNTVNANVTATETIDPATAPKIEFANLRHDFGTIPYGKKVNHDFEFTNTGKSALVIKDVKPSCGCTVPEKPKQPFAPGEKGVINVVYSPKAHNGNQGSSVTVETNTIETKQVLSISANVTNAPEKPKKQLKPQIKNNTVSPNAPVQ